MKIEDRQDMWNSSNWFLTVFNHFHIDPNLTCIWILKPTDPPQLWKTRIFEKPAFVFESRAKYKLKTQSHISICLAFLPQNHVKMQEMLFQRPYLSKFWDVSCLRRSAPSGPCGDQWSVRVTSIAFTQIWGLCFHNIFAPPALYWALSLTLSHYYLLFIYIFIYIAY